MNEMIKKLQERRSVREFTGEKVKDEDLKLILETAIKKKKRGGEKRTQ